MPHDPLSAVLDMVQAIERAHQLSAGLGEAGFLADERAQWAVYSQIVILGEAAGRVDKEFQRAHPEIPWSTAIGMRHRLVHGYDSVDWLRVWKTLQDDLPPLLQQLRGLLPHEEGRKR
ncbi:MAG: DUF86 domain-containing protein [Nitrospirae bacterium]|nr:DUF86 domain-containing protein [Nitrospirota bacterium]